MSDDSDILLAFVAEATDHLDDIENQLLQIEAAGEDVDVELVNTVFRGVHSIKGAAGFLGLSSINRLSHGIENVLNLFRNRELVPDSEIINGLLRATDQLVQLFDHVDTSDQVDVSSHLEFTAAVVAGAEITSENEAERARSPIVADTPDPPLPDDLLRDADLDLVEPAQTSGPAVILDSQDESTVQDAPVAVATAPAVRRGSRHAETSIRVPVETLDMLMNLAGELVLGRNQLVQALAVSEMQDLEAAASRLNYVTCNMQDAIMKTRMQPIGTVFSRFTRLVRDITAKCGKQCRLVTEGLDVEVDKTIIEAIGDPLTHLIRNALDHGIEAPSARLENGKEAEGTIHLSARHESGKVRIAIEDDGHGIDLQRVKNLAVERQLISPQQALELSDRDVARLIFLAGFSTADQVSDLSGRGVGMDVVRTNIEKLGGAVNISTVAGRGTRFEITLPLTLAIIPSLIIECCEDRFAIPQVAILELVRIAADDVAERTGRIKGADVLRLRGRLLPLVNLAESLGLRRNRNPQELADTSEGLHVVIVETGHLQFGLIVDGMFDCEEIVVKPLDRHANQSACLSGATILGDGRVALIVDVAGLAESRKLHSYQETESSVGDDDQRERSHSDAQMMLLLANHPSERFAIPLGSVSRIERYAAAHLGQIGGQRILSYRGASLQLLELEKLISARPREAMSHLHLVVFQHGEREVGLIAPILIDIREVDEIINDDVLREPGVCGTVLIDDIPTRLLDVGELGTPTGVRRKPADFQKTTLGFEDGGTVLVAEDSPFFQARINELLVNNGYQVVISNDGVEAWNELRDNPAIDLVLTDIEMPNMNGFELCSRIRSNPSLAQLPVIALTTLTSKDDLERGQECGMDDFLMKMNNDQLLNSLRSFLQQREHAAAGT